MIRYVRSFIGLGVMAERLTLCDDRYRWPAIAVKVVLGPFIINFTIRVGRLEQNV